METEKKIWEVGTLTYTKAGLVSLFAWLLWGDFCFTLMEQVIPSIMPLKFKALGASNALMAIVISSAPSLLNTIFIPIVSFRSDRTRTPLGRRIPYLLGSVPLLGATLLGLGVHEPICRGLQPLVTQWFGGMSLTSLVLIYLCIFQLAFSFFNIFVTSIFWYFFNDVVPEKLMARFISCFRIVSAGSATLYNWFIFKRAETHFMEIFVGAGILYVIGFGLMCLKIKEGKYPPPSENIDHRKGLLSSTKTYFSECMTTRHYWYLYLTTFGTAITLSTNLYTIFLLKQLGLNLEQIGKINAIHNISYIVWLGVFGFLADRYHPLRTVLVGKIGALLLAPLGLIWLFWLPPAGTVFYYYLLFSTLGTTAVNALAAIVEIPLLMRIFPRDRYGQFCSARAMCGSFFAIAVSALLGLLLDVFQKSLGGRVYLFLPIWNIVGLSMTVCCLFLLYRSWQKYGGDEHYIPPTTSNV